MTRTSVYALLLFLPVAASAHGGSCEAEGFFEVSLGFLFLLSWLAGGPGLLCAWLYALVAIDGRWQWQLVTKLFLTLLLGPLLLWLVWLNLGSMMGCVSAVERIGIILVNIAPLFICIALTKRFVRLGKTRFARNAAHEAELD